MPIFKGLKSKLGAGEPKKETKAKPLPPRLAFTEQTYPDEYIIKNFDDLFSKTVRVWRGGDWNKNVRNGATGALFESSHHVPGEGAKDRAAFKDGKFGFCLEWINFLYEGKVYRVRYHPKAVYKDGPNRIYDLLNWGETIRYGMIKDIGAPEVPLTDEQRRLQAVKDLKELENRLGVAYDDGQPAEELTNQVEIMRRAISNKSYLLEDRSNAAPQPSAPATILNSRKALSNNAPGNPDLDAKAKRNPNNAAKGGKTAFTRALDSINEHPGS
ncbi:hypothetical protein J4E86_005042 [Alternaria arbusti]|uniref:uncharacterized protein n=1 Tax=Alternaria arbusti TaxID=232088 RepID=UPI002220F98A|nr:uncharacterized protein J4E86_005042 [Alternaria arbusti]KAI4957902.1 hypothetical protein J4E86_005042 [Alternaria arbusti]